MLLTQKEKSSYMHVTVLYSYGLFPSILLYLLEYLGHVSTEVFIDLFRFAVSSFHLVLHRRSIS